VGSQISIISINKVSGLDFDQTMSVNEQLLVTTCPCILSSRMADCGRDGRVRGAAQSVTYYRII